jgi:hypothetical protein
MIPLPSKCLLQVATKNADGHIINQFTKTINKFQII